MIIMWGKCDQPMQNDQNKTDNTDITDTPNFFKTAGQSPSSDVKQKKKVKFYL